MFEVKLDSPANFFADSAWLGVGVPSLEEARRYIADISHLGVLEWLSDREAVLTTHDDDLGFVQDFFTIYELPEEE